MTWTVYTGAVAYTIETCDTAGLAAAIHRRYRGTIRGAYEVRLDLGDDLQPTGKGVVLATDTGGAGFTTIVLPAASAGPTLVPISVSGKL